MSGRKQKAHIKLTLNGEPAEVAFAPHKTLLEVLREDLGLMGTKHGCELGECGTCAVLVDGRSILSCLMLGLDAEGREVETIEGMATAEGLHPLQETFADLGAAQCGYCTPGFLLVAKELLKRSEERRVGKESRYWRDWSSDVCSSDLLAQCSLTVARFFLASCLASMQKAERLRQSKAWQLRKVFILCRRLSQTLAQRNAATARPASFLSQKNY